MLEQLSVVVSVLTESNGSLKIPSFDGQVWAHEQSVEYHTYTISITGADELLV